MIVWGGYRLLQLFEHWRQIQSQHRQLDSHQHHQCARCPRRSHGSLDRQRNDRLGRQHQGTTLNTGGRYNPRTRQLDSHQHHQRAHCANVSHGGLDRQRNDRLGWSWRRQLFQHRRQILRGCSGSDTHANIYLNTNGDRDRDTYSHNNCDSDSYGDCKRNSNCNGYTHAYGYSDGYSHAYAHTDANSYGNSNTYRHGDANTYTDADADTYCDAYGSHLLPPRPSPPIRLRTSQVFLLRSMAHSIHGEQLRLFISSMGAPPAMAR